MPREIGTDTAARPLSPAPAQLDLMNAWWRAANYLSVGQIYLLDNPLLDRPLERSDIKPRLLGHWARRRGSISFMCI
jgi:xylulose-5-phosphate/fructose-6-phosphate phosphoketolase